MRNKVSHAAYMQEWIRLNPERWAKSHLPAAARWRARNPEKVAFWKQRYHAKRRGIEFLFTFEEWRDWWGEDFCLRGVGSDDLCMARYEDSGPYHPGNVQKLTGRENRQAA